MVDGESVIENFFLIEDVFVMDDILLRFGVKIEYDNYFFKIDVRNLYSYIVLYESVKKIRVLYYFIGVFFIWFGRVEVVMLGGCNFGLRLIDQYIKGFRVFGVEVKIENGMIKVYVDRFVGIKIYLDVVFVGVIINFMFVVVKVKGIIIIENVVKELYVVDIVNFLNSMGVKIKGVGIDVIRIEGVDKFYLIKYVIIFDQIEVGIYMIVVCVIKGYVIVKNVIFKYLELFIVKFVEMGVEVIIYEDSIEVICRGRFRSVSIKIMLYLGFFIDFQFQMIVLLSFCSGISVVIEGVWENRYQYVDEFKKMGVNIKVEGRVVVVEGVESFQGVEVVVVDF